MLIISYDCIKTKERIEKEGKDIRGVFRKYEKMKCVCYKEEKGRTSFRQSRKKSEIKGEKRKFRREKEETGRENQGDRLAISH